MTRLHHPAAAATLALFAALGHAQSPPLPPVITANPALIGVVLPWEDPGDLTPGYKLIDGDIQVPRDFNPLLDATYIVTTWPAGLVPYEFDANVTLQSWRDGMLVAMAEWSSRTGVRFVPRVGHVNYIHIQDSSGNNAPVGWRAGQSNVNITSWNGTFVMAHELGHILGYFHEHQRPDRDTYVQINLANVQSGHTHNFPIVSSSTGWGPYDFDSNMHYTRCAFSTCCPSGSSCFCSSSCETITVRPTWHAQWNEAIGNLSHLSSMDWGVMRGLYPETGDRWLDASYGGTVNGSFQQPFNGSFQNAYSNTVTGGTLFIAPGTYNAFTGLYNTRRTIKAPGGGVHIH